MTRWNKSDVRAWTGGLGYDLMTVSCMDGIELLGSIKPKFRCLSASHDVLDKTSTGSVYISLYVVTTLKSFVIRKIRYPQDLVTVSEISWFRHVAFLSTRYKGCGESNETIRQFVTYKKRIMASFNTYPSIHS